MSVQDLLRLFRARWVIVFVTALVTVLGAMAYTLLQTPLYQASTRLFVSATYGANATEVYQGSRYSQERVLSYIELLKGETLANRTIDRLDLNMNADDLKAKVTAKSKPDTVLITVSVLDDSPVRARDIANALSDEFVVVARELETPQPGASPDARVVVEQRASIPRKPLTPKPVRNLVLSIALGALLGIGLALLRDQLDNTIKTHQTLEQITGVGIVGYIPFDKERSTTPAINFDNDNSGPAEAFRKLRTNLQFLTVDDPPRVLVVTSASPSEGKSISSLNIALALAEADHNVVLVDGDLRRPRVAKYLDVMGSVGVSTLLGGGACLSEVLQKTKYPGLTVLAAGPCPPNPSELLGSLTAQKLLSELRAEFDYVIIDSSPLMAVTDGAILAAQADGALLAARYGSTTREQLTHSVRILNDVGAKILGAVFTMIPSRGSGSYSYNYYYYGNSYGDDKLGQAARAHPLPNTDITKRKTENDSKPEAEAAG